MSKPKKGDRWIEKKTRRVVEVLSTMRGHVHIQNLQSRRAGSMMLTAFLKDFEFKQAKTEPEIIYLIPRTRPSLRKTKGPLKNQLPLPGVH